MIHMGDEYHLWWLALGESNRLLAKDTDCWHSMNNANTHGWWHSLGDDTHWVMTTMDSKDHWSLIIDHWSSQTEDYHGWWWLVMVLVMVVDSHWCHSLGDDSALGWKITGWCISGSDGRPLSHIHRVTTVMVVTITDDQHRMLPIMVNDCHLWWLSPSDGNNNGWWLSPDDDWCHLTIMISIMDDDSHWEMRTLLWCHSLGDENHCYRSSWVISITWWWVPWVMTSIDD